MKKLFSIMSLILCFAILQFSAFAAELPNENKNATKISVSFKAGTGAYDVNGKSVKGEVSAQTGGKTFVPVNVITDALGANLNVDLKAKTAVINYNSVDIKLTEKKKEAVVAGKKINIDAAPYIKNNSFMASITSLADMLGADVSTSDGKITFVKEIANPNSIKDFSSLIKKTKKSKVGDSYYKWSMQLPNDLKLEYRNFNGSENIFSAQDGSYSVVVAINDTKKESSIDDFIKYVNDKIKGFTRIDFVEDSNNGEKYAEFVYCDDKNTVRERCYITKTTVYDILIITENDDDYDDEKYKSLVQSFDFNCNKDGSTEDLSDVTKDGYRKYLDTRLKWSVDMIPYYEEVKVDNIRNVIAFYGKEYEYFSVQVYSIDKDDTLDSITQKSLDDDAAHYNSEFYSVTKQEKVEINGVEGNKVFYTLKFPDITVYGYEMFFVDNNYKYIVRAEIPENVYNHFNKKKLVEGMINSFSFQKLDAKATGKLLDPNKISMNGRVRTLDEAGFTMSIPVEWTEDDENTDTYQYFYSPECTFSISTIDEVDDLNRLAISFDKILNSKSNIKVESKSTITGKDTNYVKYVIQVKGDNGIAFNNEIYLIQKGNKAYILEFSVNKIFYSTTNIDIIKKAWESFTLK